MSKLFTIGYGGTHPVDFAACLSEAGVRTIVDVRLRPDRASMGSYTRATTADKGIQRLLADHGIHYASFVEMGNLFVERADWRTPYRLLLERVGDVLIERLARVSAPLCLMCAERSPAECHRALIADFLMTRGYEVEHLGGRAENPIGDPPKGFTYESAFLADREQERLLAWLSGLTYEHQRMRGAILKRGQAQFGWTYLAGRRSVIPAEPFPPGLDELARTVSARCATLVMFDQCIVSRYPVGAAIGWHMDATLFGDVIAGVSVGASAHLSFRRPGAAAEYTHFVETGSLYVMRGPARWAFQHRVAAPKAERFSLTFRTLGPHVGVDTPYEPPRAF